MVVEVPVIFNKRKDLVERIFNWENFYSKGLGDSKFFFQESRVYEEAVNSFTKFENTMNRKFNTYVDEIKKYLEEGVLEKKNNGRWEYSLTEFGMECIKSYFKWQVEKEEESKKDSTLISILKEKGFLDDSGKLNGKGFEYFQSPL